jgi:hypothetical protein
VGYFPIVRIDHYMYLLKCQIRVSKTVFYILLYVSPSNTMRKKLPPTQLSKECFTAVVASNRHSAATSSVKWDVYGHCMRLRFECSKKVFPIRPIANDAETSFSVSMLIVRTLIESMAFSHTALSQSE